MKKQLTLLIALLSIPLAYSQNYMSARQLIELNRVNPLGINKDGTALIYQVTTVDLDANSKTNKYYQIDLNAYKKSELSTIEGLLADKHFSPDGSKKIVTQEVKLRDVYGSDYYPELDASNMMIINSLNYRHWDAWEDGAFSHILIENSKTGERMDIMAGEPFDCPQKPFGGEEDYCWSPDGKQILYVSKKLEGTNYALSTNTDIYVYDLASLQTSNLTAENKGYDTHPSFSSTGILAWLQMKNDGYEADKNDLVVLVNGKKQNLTADWDNSVMDYQWSKDGAKIFFSAAVLGSIQLFEISLPKATSKKPAQVILPRQITQGQFDIRGIVGQKDQTLFVGRGDMNHATELYSVDLKTGVMKQLTFENDMIYKSLTLGKVEKRITKTVDGKDLHSWVIYPPDFDPAKKYPTILYCQGGPQGALSQFYSYRWNFQLMAAHGYIVIAPNRRGMSGYGVAWNEQISKDYGGLNMQDYLRAIDDLSTETYVDKERIACVGASYGGYSAFYLAAIHENRFKTFIAHDGIFNWKSMYGTTEELFFTNWDIGGPYWDKKNVLAQKGYNEFNPVEQVAKWNRPIMIIQGGKDYRVPIGQGLEAFQAAQLLGLKSRLLYFPEENHWVLGYQNSYIWHTEFFKWLAETL